MTPFNRIHAGCQDKHCVVPAHAVRKFGDRPRSDEWIALAARMRMEHAGLEDSEANDPSLRKRERITLSNMPLAPIV